MTLEQALVAGAVAMGTLQVIEGLRMRAQVRRSRNIAEQLRDRGTR